MVNRLLFFFFASLFMLACGNKTTAPEVVAEPVTMTDRALVSDTLKIDVILQKLKQQGTARLGGLITNLSDSITYKDPVIRYSYVTKEDDSTVTVILSDSCQVHIEIAPRAMMTFVSDCVIPYKNADSIDKKQYYGKVKSAERVQKNK